MLISLIQQLIHFCWVLLMLLMVNKHLTKSAFGAFSDLVKSVKLKAPSIIHIFRIEPDNEPDFCFKKIEITYIHTHSKHT